MNNKDNIAERVRACPECPFVNSYKNLLKAKLKRSQLKDSRLISIALEPIEGQLGLLDK